MGSSQGGFASLWLATQSKRYAAVVSLNGWTDMYSESMNSSPLNELYPNEWPYRGDFERYEATAGTDFSMGASVWEQPEKMSATVLCSTHRLCRRPCC
jgi:hypothetical protein